MTWVKRTLWLAAWGGWVWLGFGLSRELPRHVEQKKIDPPRDERKWFCGDMEDGTSVTRIDGDDAGLSSRYDVVDTATGRLLHEWKGPDQDYPRWESSRLSVVAGVNRDAVEAGTEEPFQLLDLRTGAWTPLGGMLLHIEGEHPSRPWIIIDDGTVVSSRLRVYDVDAKRWLFDWAQTQDQQVAEEEVNRVWFEDDELVVVVEHRRRWGAGRRPEPYPESQRLERWHVPSKTRVATVAIDPPARYIAPWPNGRMLLVGRSSLPDSASLVDIRSLQTVFMAPALDEGERAWLEIPMRVVLPQPSASGRTLLTQLGRLWSVEDGHVLWRHSETERVESRDSSSNSFCTREEWTPWLKAFHLPFSLTTTAIRDLETGCVRFRTFVPTPDEASTRLITDNGLRPSPNWLLLAFCQTIVALPLILLWAALRWRRKSNADALLGVHGPEEANSHAILNSRF
jgi:hypothetical protein